MEDLKKELISRAGSSTALLISQILNTKKYENEITHLKKEVIELQEKLHAKTATNGTNDNHSLDADINPNDYQFNHECMVKEEILGQNKDVQSELREEKNGKYILKRQQAKKKKQKSKELHKKQSLQIKPIQFTCQGRQEGTYLSYMYQNIPLFTYT